MASIFSVKKDKIICREGKTDKDQGLGKVWNKYYLQIQRINFRVINDGFNFRNGESEMGVSHEGRFAQQDVGFNKCLLSSGSTVGCPPQG